MKIRYSPDTDIILFELKEDTPYDSIDLSEGIIVHFNKKKQPIEIELIDASKITNVEEMNFSVPFRSTETEVINTN